MKATALFLSLVLALVAFALPVAAQDEAEPSEAVVCLRLTGDVSLDGVSPFELGQLLLDGQIDFEVIEGTACAVDEPEDEPMAEDVAKDAGTPYVTFVAHGAGAAIEVAALAEKHEGVESLADLDAAAVSVAAWAKQQRKWLDNHPPQACYKDVHQQWRKGVVQVRKAAKSARKAIRTLQPKPMRVAVRKLTAGIDNLVSVDLKAAGEACAQAD